MKFNTAMRSHQSNAALLLLSALLSVSVFAQSQPPAKKAVKAVPKPAEKVAEPAAPVDARIEAPVAPPAAMPKPFAPVFFDPAAPVLQYVQNEPRKVYDWVVEQLVSVPGKPDKFSSLDERSAYDAALAARMGGLGAIPIIGRCILDYNIAYETYEVKALAAPVKSDIDGSHSKPEALNLRRVTLGKANEKTDSYEASNAYGAITKVLRNTSDNYALVLSGIPGNEPSSALARGASSSVLSGYLHDFYYYRQSVKMPRDMARSLEKDIGCLYVASLAAPWVVTYQERTSPTRSDPIDETDNYFALYGKLDMVAVINKATGEIYSKVERGR